MFRVWASKLGFGIIGFEFGASARGLGNTRHTARTVNSGLRGTRNVSAKTG